MLQFVPFSSCMDSNFWHKLSHVKLNEYGLNDSYVDIKGYYCNYLSENLDAFMNVDYESFDCDISVPNKCFKVLGCLKITNTIEDFVSSDKNALIKREGKKIWDAILSKEAMKDPELLMRFLLLTYADLKKFTFHYWCAFPALNFKEKFSIIGNPSPLADVLSQEKIDMLLRSYEIFSNQNNFPSVFLVRNANSNVEIGTFDKFAEWNGSGDEIVVSFADPSTSPTHPGWPLRNILIFISRCWFEDLKGEVKVLCFRDRTKDGIRSISHSLLLQIKLIDLKNETECPDVVGWERDGKNVLKPRRVDLSSQMDPLKLCESSVDLNLKLMKWRLLPDLNLDVISSSKFLLLGSGTLGCNVARGLLGWGVRNITLVDNSRISYSNPVRQSLFTYGDCLDGGKHKAQAAADALKLIFPQVNAVGINLSIPMPGHNVTCNLMEKVREDVEKLEQLIESHDVIYLLMDTRESRWLPTLIGKAKSKIVISASLGFGTFLVIRNGMEFHGELPTIKNNATSKIPVVIPGHDLGCYFCNDVTSPGNSTTDRTLDQQCTVTRPGVSMIASACAVELAISILHHPLRGLASATTKQTDDSVQDESILGVVPHQIRGFLSSFNNISTATFCFDKCTACSAKVLEAYRNGGFDFLFKVFNSPSLLEDLTGLTLLNQQAIDMSNIDFSENEDDIEIWST